MVFFRSVHSKSLESKVNVDIIFHYLQVGILGVRENSPSLCDTSGWNTSVTK
jgi:hypothetical protein